MKKLIFVVIALTVASSACGSSTPSTSSASGPLPTVPADYAGQINSLGTEAAPAGGNVFKTYCVSCHGEGGKGDGSASQALDPRPANLVEVNKIAADDFLYWRINTGVLGTSMPAWKGVLTEEQIWQVVSFIRTLK